MSGNGALLRIDMLLQYVECILTDGVTMVTDLLFNRLTR